MDGQGLSWLRSLEERSHAQQRPEASTSAAGMGRSGARASRAVEAPLPNIEASKDSDFEDEEVGSYHRRVK